MPALMVQGCSTAAGKSLLTTALARYFARQGLRVAPFKAVEVSTSAQQAGDGELASAQYLQALAAGVTPDVRMNPVLVRPGELVLLGQAGAGLSQAGWPARVWPHIEQAYRSLAAGADLMLIEGAGSPAEPAGTGADVANMRVAALASAPVLLVADGDRGGALAHLFGTWSLLPAPEQARVRGFVLNRVRGEAGLPLAAAQELRRLTGVPVAGMLPWLEHALPGGDGAGPQPASLLSPAGPAGDDAPAVAVIRYPAASNLDEFRPLASVARVVWAEQAADLAAVAPARAGSSGLVILPGSHHVARDLAWLRDREFPLALSGHRRSGGRILGICGGLQMLGAAIEDPFGIDGSAVGLGWLPLRTRFAQDKTTRPVRARFAGLPAPWSALTGIPVSGHEIRHGVSTPARPLAEAIPGGLGYADGPVLGVYLHGMLDSPAARAALFGRAGDRGLAASFDLLADAVEEHLDAALLRRLAGL